jgi:hypothetical protein
MMEASGLFLLENRAMFRLFIGALLASFAFAVMAPAAPDQKTKVEITEKWSGSVEDENVKKPEVIVSTKGLEAVWKDWKIKGDVPKVDFTKNIVVAVYSSGSKLNLSGANLDDKGNLEVLGLGTRDFRPGFRYVLGVVSKKGIKTVNKKELPKE